MHFNQNPDPPAHPDHSYSQPILNPIPLPVQLITPSSRPPELLSDHSQATDRSRCPDLDPSPSDAARAVAVVPGSRHVHLPGRFFEQLQRRPGRSGTRDHGPA